MLLLLPRICRLLLAFRLGKFLLSSLVRGRLSDIGLSQLLFRKFFLALLDKLLENPDVVDLILQLIARFKKTHLHILATLVQLT